MAWLLAIHVLAAVVWVGGMFFAYIVLRPAALPLETPVRLALWVRTFSRFFPYVWGSVILLPVTGYIVIIHRFGGMAFVPPFVNAMQGLGWLMIFIYLHVFFAPYRKLCRNVNQKDYPAAGRALSQIRVLIGVNTVLGLITLIVAVIGGS